MEIKKSPQADLEQQRVTYFLLGLIVALSTFFVLLEWETEKPAYSDWDKLPVVFIEEEYSGFKDSNLSEKTIFSFSEEKPEAVYEDYNVVEKIESKKEDTSIGAESSQDIQDSIIPAPETEDNFPEDVVYENPEIKPEFPGGLKALSRYLFLNLKYPASARTQQIQGRVWCSFVVNKDGSISDVKIERGVYVSLDQESLKTLRQMPPWNPGIINGEPVKTKVFIPIVFKL